jgi:hypothetical protein
MRMSDAGTTPTTSDERLRGQSVANPRRVRVGRDGRPLPLSVEPDHAA